MPARVLVRPTESGYALWCFLSPDSAHTEGSNAVRHALALALADYIVAEREEELVRFYLRRAVRHADPGEASRILRHARAHLGAGDGEDAEGRRAKRRRLLAAGLLSFLIPGQPLVLEGVLRFRLHAYRRELERAVHRGFDDYRSECQYREFVRLLRLLVSGKPPRVAHLHVVYAEQGVVRLFDDAFRPIGAEAMRAVLQEEPDALEDVLLSALVALAPARLTLHGRATDGRVVETLRQVFEGKAFLCSGCALCGSLSAPARPACQDGQGQAEGHGRRRVRQDPRAEKR